MTEMAGAVVVLWSGPWGSPKEASKHIRDLGAVSDLDHGLYLGFGREDGFFAFLQRHALRYVGMSESHNDGIAGRLDDHSGGATMSRITGANRAFWVGRIISSEAEPEPIAGSSKVRYPDLRLAEHAMIYGLQPSLNVDERTKAPVRPIAVMNLFANSFDIAEDASDFLHDAEKPAYLPDLVAYQTNRRDCTVVWDREATRKLTRGTRRNR